MVKQNTDEWLEMRKTKIGASDLPIILGLSPYKTPYQLWLEKSGRIEGQTSSAMEYGKNNEQMIREQVSSEIGLELDDVVVFHPSCDWAMASLDGFAEGVIAEIKCANAQDHKTAQQGNVPEKYMPQLLWQMFCAEAESCYYCSFHKNNLVIVEVARDEGFINKCYDEAKKFYELMVTDTPPSLTGADLEFKDEAVFVALIEELRDLRAQLDAGKKRAQEIETQIWERAGPQGCQGKDFRCSVYERKGTIDYKKLCEEQGVEEEILDMYRKDAVSVRMIKL